MKRSKKSLIQYLLIFSLIGLLAMFLIPLLPKLEHNKSNKSITSKYIKIGKVHASTAEATSSHSAVLFLTPKPTITPTLIASPSGFCLTVPVLYYHHVQPLATAALHKNISLTVDPVIFDQQMRYLVS